MTYGIRLILMRAVESLKIFTLIGSICPKQTILMSPDTEEWCKVWRKTDSWFQRWHEEFGEF